MGFFFSGIYAEDNQPPRNLQLTKEIRGPDNLGVLQYRIYIGYDLS